MFTTLVNQLESFLTAQFTGRWQQGKRDDLVVIDNKEFYVCRNALRRQVLFYDLSDNENEIVCKYTAGDLKNLQSIDLAPLVRYVEGVSTKGRLNGAT